MCVGSVRIFYFIAAIASNFLEFKYLFICFIQFVFKTYYLLGRLFSLNVWLGHKRYFLNATLKNNVSYQSKDLPDVCVGADAVVTLGNVGYIGDGLGSGMTGDGGLGRCSPASGSGIVP